jgi:hypothetical protein
MAFCLASIELHCECDVSTIAEAISLALRTLVRVCLQERTIPFIVLFGRQCVNIYETVLFMRKQSEIAVAAACTIETEFTEHVGEIRLFS